MTRGHGKFERGRLTGSVTPYSMTPLDAGGWRIGYGLSGFLVAYGSGWSRPLGRKMYAQLVDEYWQRKRPRRPIKAKAKP